jgi:predicted phosphodiesterase
MIMNQNESYADFVVRVMTNLEDFKLTKQEAFKTLFNREMANDNIRKVSYLASYIQEAIDSGYYKKFLGEDVIETPKEEINSFYKSDEVIEQEDNEYLLKSNQQLRKQLQNIRDCNNLLRAEQRHLYRFDDIMSKIHEAMQEISKSYTERFPVPIIDIEAITNDVYIIQISDTHFNQVVELNHNQYNLKIAKERLTKLFTKHLCELKRRNINNVVIAFTGDLVNLAKLKEQYLTNELPSRIEATIRGFETLSEQIDRLIEEGIKLSFVACVGNEARLDMFEKLGNVDSIVRDNFDYMLFQQLKARYGRNCYFINEGDCLEQVFKIKDKNILIVHGDKLNHSNLSKTVSTIRDKYMNNYKVYVDYIIIGHLHSTLIGDGFARSSSIVGASEYSYNGLNLSGNDISQLAHIIYDDEIVSIRVGV